MKDLFKEFLELSDRLRLNYSNSLGLSLGLPKLNIVDKNNYPLILDTIYSIVQGTLRDIENQVLMDFIPGYYLIHQSQLINNLEKQNEILKSISDKKLIPFLANYSSDFISVEIETGKIYYIYHDDNELYLGYSTSLLFLKTIVEHYKKNVFFLDDDGYLDYNPDLEIQISSKINPEIEFWK